MDAAAQGHALERLRRASLGDLNLAAFWRRCNEILAFAVPHMDAPCWFTCDPDSLLVTSHFQEGVPEIPGDWLAQEYLEPDFNKMTDVAQSKSGVSTLHDATGGRPERSIRYARDMVAYGAYQEVLTALRTRSGEVWGMLGLYRRDGQPLFDQSEQHFLAAAAPFLAEGARRALLAGEASDPETADAPGLLILDAQWKPVSMTPHAAEHLAHLPGSRRPGELPPAVYAVAGAALSAGGESDAMAQSRLRTVSGRWMTLHASAMAASDGDRQVAVIVQPAMPAKIAPLLMAAYGLTERERDVTRLALRGESTAEIAESLAITANTVQQHLKGIFEKTGVNSRRELSSKVFFAHYEPRLRDNERRVIEDLPIRGGPLMPGRVR